MHESRLKDDMPSRIKVVAILCIATTAAFAFVMGVADIVNPPQETKMIRTVCSSGYTTEYYPARRSYSGIQNGMSHYYFNSDDLRVTYMLLPGEVCKTEYKND